ncbi:MAG: hypothetical protein ACYTXT_01255 [Nostoc sp.]
MFIRITIAIAFTLPQQAISNKQQAVVPTVVTVPVTQPTQTTTNGKGG